MGASRILEKQNWLQMSQVFPFPCIGDQMYSQKVTVLQLSYSGGHKTPLL